MISPTRKHVSSGKNKLPFTLPFVTFHRKTGVFELRPGNMLYAFCINAGGHLEHSGVNFARKSTARDALFMDLLQGCRRPYPRRHYFVRQ